MLPVLLALWVMVSLAGCSPSPPQLNSGIEGRVFIGPTCPVVIEGMDCADKPYQATLTVLTLSGDKVTRFDTDEDGHFRVNLAPGEYLLHPEPPDGMGLPYGAEQAFTVEEGQFTQLLVAYDSGIR